MSNDTGASGKVVIADAVRFTYVKALPAAPHLDAIALLPDRRAQIQISGSTGQYSIDGSSNLSDWLPLTNIAVTSSPFMYVDPATNLALRFYRARLAP